MHNGHWIAAALLLSCRSEGQHSDNDARAANAKAGAASSARTAPFVVLAKSSEPAPLVLLLHGYGGDARDVLAWSGLSSLSDRAHVVAPEGTLDSTGRRFWNANAVCCDFEGRKPDDVAYLLSVLSDVSARARVDAKRVYVLGLSNGGAMAMRLACDAASTFASVVSFAGPSAPSEACAPTRPIPIRIVHGTADRVVPFEGGEGIAPGHPNAKGALGSVRALARRWADRNGCGEARSEGAVDYVPALPGAETRLDRFVGCKARVELLVVENGPHVPTLSTSFAESTWDFFRGD